MVLLPSRLGAPHGFILRCWLRDLQLTWDLLVESQLSCLAIMQSFHVVLGGYNHPLSISFVHEWQEKNETKSRPWTNSIHCVFIPFKAVTQNNQKRKKLQKNGRLNDFDALRGGKKSGPLPTPILSQSHFCGSTCPTKATSPFRRCSPEAAPWSPRQDEVSWCTSGQAGNLRYGRLYGLSNENDPWNKWKNLPTLGWISTRILARNFHLVVKMVPCLQGMGSSFHAASNQVQLAFICLLVRVPALCTWIGLCRSFISRRGLWVHWPVASGFQSSRQQN